MKRGGWLGLVGEVVDGSGLTGRVAMRMRESGSSLLVASWSWRKGSSEMRGRGGLMAWRSRVSSE